MKKTILISIVSLFLFSSNNSRGLIADSEYILDSPEEVEVRPSRIKARTMPKSLLRDIKQSDDHAADLIESAEERAQQVLRDAQMEAAKIKEQAKEGYSKLKEDIKEEVSKLTSKVEEEGLKLGNKAERDALILKNEARQKALRIINQAEERALRIKNKELEGALPEVEIEEEEVSIVLEPNKDAKDFGQVVASGKKKVTPEWKETVENQFSDDVVTLRQIILEGEADKDEKEGFLQQFKEQRMWFDKTVSGTQYFLDPNYNAVMQKRSSIHRVVSAQEKADEFLKEAFEKDTFDEAVRRKIRLVVLYDLNSLIQKEVEKGVASLYEAGLQDSVIKDAVNKVIEDAKLKVGKLPSLEKVGVGEVETIEGEVKKLKKDLETQSQERSEFEQDIKNKLEEKNKANIELDLLLKKTEQKIEKLKKETESQVEGRLKPEIEAKNKENLDLQLRLQEVRRDLEREMDQLKQEVAKAKSRAEADEKLRSKAEAKAEAEEKLRLETESRAKLETEVAQQKSDQAERQAEEAFLGLREDYEQKLDEQEKLLEEERKEALERESELLRLKQEAKDIFESANRRKLEEELKASEFEFQGSGF